MCTDNNQRNRRTMLVATAATLGAIAACGSREPDDGATGARHSQDGGDSDAASPRPTWRNAGEVPVEPDGEPRHVAQTSPEGRIITVQGVTLTVPQAASDAEFTDQAGDPGTQIRIDGAEHYFPRVAVQQAEHFGRPLLQETYNQEVLLDSQNMLYVTRSRETWPGTDEAFLMTWADHAEDENGNTIDIDGLGFWLSDGTEDGGWVIYAAAPTGQLTEGSPTWNTAFSLQLP